MKKEENIRTNPNFKSFQEFRSRSHSPKAYLGCNTCKQKNGDVKKIFSVNKISDIYNCQDRNKCRKPPPEREVKKPKIKLTDLCEDDKKRIVQLIEELSKLAEKNEELKESLDRMHISKLEQQDYIIKQANTHLEEKTIFVNEINEYKTKIENLESKIKDNLSQWENQEKLMDLEILHLAKALKKSIKEKKNLIEQLNHLKLCLRQSLDSFQKLKVEVNELQEEQKLKTFSSKSCQTDIRTTSFKEKFRITDEDTDEEYLSTGNQSSVKNKSSLDIINDKLEHVYQILKKKSENISKHYARQPEVVDLAVLSQIKKHECAHERKQTKEKQDEKEVSEEDTTENEFKFLKPFDECSKTSIQAERILKKIGKPLNLSIKECVNKLENNKLTNGRLLENLSNEDLTSNLYQNKIIQKNRVYLPSDGREYDEDRLLEELFYSDQSAKFGLESFFRNENRKAKKLIFDRHFT